MDALQVPGTLDSLAAIRAYARTAAEQAGVDKKRTYRLQLAIDEVATNIVNYGYNNGELRGDIEVGVEVNPRRLTITLKDSAPPFNPFAKQSPGDLTQPLDTRPVGGLGVFLAFKNVDEFRYAYEDGQNHNIFVLRLEQATSTNASTNGTNATNASTNTTNGTNASTNTTNGTNASTNGTNSTNAAANAENMETNE